MSAWTEGRWPGRFVVVATLRRGALPEPEVLDDANQWRALSAWREDESRRERVEYELGYEDCCVVWVKKPLRYEGRVYVEPQAAEG